MKKLPPQKRNQLVLVGLATALVLGGLWFGLIGMQRSSLARIHENTSAAEQKLAAVKKAITSADQVEAELQAEAAKLSKYEEGMASGDLYSWTINTVRKFKLPYRVEIPQFSQIDGPRDVNLLADFPYQQASITIGGTGHYYDIGSFVADFENTFPHARVCNLVLEPVAAASGADREKLLFRMDLVFLVKPTGA